MRLLYTISFLFFIGNTIAQSNLRDQKISMDYKNAALSTVIADLESSYNIEFAYSNDKIPLEEGISTSVKNVNLVDGLDDMFSSTQIDFAIIGDQVVLRQNTEKEIVQKIKVETNLNKPRKSKPVKFKPIGYQLPKTKVDKRPSQKEIKPLDKKKSTRLVQIDVINPKEKKEEVGKYRISFEAIPEEESTKIGNAQISLTPKLAAKSGDGKKNKVSVNLLWGENESLDGVEVGGLLNRVEKDAKGAQFAGVGNVVGGNVNGLQMSGVFNEAKGNVKGAQLSSIFNATTDTVTGTQMSGIFNRAGSVKGAQFAGIYSEVKNDHSGLQASGIFNRSEGKAGYQLAGIFNHSEAETSVQLAGFTNKGGTIKVLQVSPFLNIAKEVRGVQFGLINWADTVSGASIGLLNFVRKGYNRIEIGSSFTTDFTLGVKFGSHRFYTILQGGFEIEGPKHIWTIGYGIGSYFRLSPKSGGNLELVFSHVNEQAGWLENLNALVQLKPTYEYKLFKNAYVYGGPVVNFMASRLYDSDTNTYGSQLAIYSLINENGDHPSSSEPINYRLWIGFNAGIRF